LPAFFRTHAAIDSAGCNRPYRTGALIQAKVNETASAVDYVTYDLKDWADIPESSWYRD